jgi:hypothetical protein
MAEGNERAWLVPPDDRSRPVLGQQQNQHLPGAKGGQTGNRHTGGERSQEWWAPAGRRLSRRVFLCLAILVVLAVLLGTLLPLLEPEKSPGHLSPQGFSQIVSSEDLKGLLAALEQTAGTPTDGMETKTRAVGTEGYERSVEFVLDALSGGDRWLKTRRMYVQSVLLLPFFSSLLLLFSSLLFRYVSVCMRVSLSLFWKHSMNLSLCVRCVTKRLKNVLIPSSSLSMWCVCYQR